MPLLKIVVEYMILGLLLALSMLALTVALERLRFYRTLVVSQYQSRAKLQKHLTHRLTIISSIASNAPYIGLLGTVLGIMFTFQSLGDSGNMDVKSIMTGLAFALKATAMGIAVAIPCVFLNNLLGRRVREKLADFDELNGA
ncbi:MAG: TonB-system energizer ExbB [Moraxella sp.]